MCREFPIVCLAALATAWTWTKQSHLIPALFLKDGKVLCPHLATPSPLSGYREFPLFAFALHFSKQVSFCLFLGFVFCTASRVHFVFSREINENGCRNARHGAGCRLCRSLAREQSCWGPGSQALLEWRRREEWGELHHLPHGHEQETRLSQKVRGLDNQELQTLPRYNER